MPNAPKPSSRKEEQTSRWRLNARQQERFRIFLTQLAEQPIFQAIGMISFVILLVAIITGGFDPAQNALTQDDVESIAIRDYKAARNFTYIEKDAEATSERRRQVVAQLPPVYDWQEDLGERLRDQIHRTFEAARTNLQDALSQQVLVPTPPTANDTSPQDVSPPRPQPTRNLIQNASPAQRILLSEPFIKEIFKDFPVELSDQELEVLASTGFSDEIESTFNVLIHRAMGSLIVPNTRVLDENRERGIYLRRLRGDTVLIEYHILDILDDFEGIESAQTELRLEAERQFAYIEDVQSRATLEQLAARLIKPNTRYNEELTLVHRAQAEQAVEEVISLERFQKGQLIVGRGESISARDVNIWERMHEERELLDMTQMILGLVLLLLLTLAILYQYGRYNIANLSFTTKDVVFLCTSLLFFLLLIKLGRELSLALFQQLPNIPLSAWQFAIPAAGFGMLVRLVLRSEHAIISSVALAAMAAIIMEEMFLYFTFTLLGCLIGAHFVRQVKHRLALMWSGLVIGVINALVIATELLWRGELFQPESLLVLIMAFGGGVLSGFLVSSLLPIVESTFGYTTDIKLLELSNLDHPLLRELILHAPGSYHHSMMVGSLCEAAAEQIGCNALLTRVGAYYHDIGKTKNPIYFAENQKYGENPHDKLKPNMSALIIKAHVKDGVEMAKHYNLPKEIVAFIEQHHGTSLIAYFYHKAKELEDPDIPEVNEKDYRYPGPKPQTRETAICLLADGIEAASKAMPNKTPARLKGLVQKMINKAFTDGQLDECDLTLKDLNAIATAFTRILTGIYHHRPQYPDAKGKGQTPQRTKQPSTPLPPSNTGAHKSIKQPAVSATSSGGSSQASSNTTSSSSPSTSHNKATSSNEHRDTNPGQSKEAPRDSKNQDDPDGEERASLPRLGPS